MRWKKVNIKNSMTCIYFRREASSADNLEIVPKLQNVELGIRNPKWNNFHNILWSFVSIFSFRFMRFKEYVYCDRDKKVVASAQVIHKIPIFRFMDRNGVHIGPCNTNMAYRGKNLYPSLLCKIVHDYPNRMVYIFTDDTNHASLRGIAKAGFKPFAVGRKNKLGCYVVEKYI